MLMTLVTYRTGCHFIHAKISLAIFTRIIRRRRFNPLDNSRQTDNVLMRNWNGFNENSDIYLIMVFPCWSVISLILKDYMLISVELVPSK